MQRAIERAEGYLWSNPSQICESTASDILESVRYSCITSSRDNIDDVPGTHQSNQGNDPNFLNRWHVGFDRMLLGALDIAPFFDNVWSAPLMPEVRLIVVVLRGSLAFIHVT